MLECFGRRRTTDGLSGRIWRRQSGLVCATRGGSVGVPFVSRLRVGLCVDAISPLQSLYLREALPRKECGGFESVRSVARCLIGMLECICAAKLGWGNGERGQAARRGCRNTRVYASICALLRDITDRSCWSRPVIRVNAVMCVANKSLGATLYVRRSGAVKVWRYLFRA